jgi:hypothetical protein
MTGDYIKSNGALKAAMRLTLLFQHADISGQGKYEFQINIAIMMQKNTEEIKP